MNRRILLITDQENAGWTSSAKNTQNSTSWHILHLRSSIDRYLEANRDLLRELSVFPVSLEAHANEAEKALEDFYPSFVYEFPRNAKPGGMSLLELLQRKGKSNLWWFGDTCEKGTQRGPLIQQLYILALLRRVLDLESFDEVWVDLADATLSDCICTGLAEKKATVRRLEVRSKPSGFRAWLVEGNCGSFFLRQIFWRWLIVLGTFFNGISLRLAGVRTNKTLQQEQAKPFIALFTRYPILWRDPYNLKAEERYFAELRPLLRQHARVRYLAWISSWPWKLWKERKSLAAVFEEQEILPLPFYLRVNDYFSVLFGSGMLSRYLRFQNKMSEKIDVRFEGWNFAPLWRAELRRVLTGPEIFQNLLIERAVARISRDLKPKALLHPSEFQPMERAIWAGASSGTTCVAFQHSITTHFSYVFPKEEIESYLQKNALNASPLPDLILVSGLRSQEMLLQAGFPKEMIGLCGALRYNHLRMETPDSHQTTTLRAKLKIPDDKLILLATTSSILGESLDLVETLAQALQPLSEKVAVLFKTHYHCRIEDQITKTMTRLNPSVWMQVLDTNLPLYDYIRASDVVLAASSTVTIETLALGRPLIAYYNPVHLNEVPVMKFRNSALFTSSPASLSKAISDHISKQVNGEQFHGARKSVISAVFYQLDGKADERAVAFLREKNLL